MPVTEGYHQQLADICQDPSMQVWNISCQLKQRTNYLTQDYLSTIFSTNYDFSNDAPTASDSKSIRITPDIPSKDEEEKDVIPQNDKQQSTTPSNNQKSNNPPSNQQNQNPSNK